MKKTFGLVFLLLQSVLYVFAQKDYEKEAISSSRYWLDINYAGDEQIGHKMDIHLPNNGSAPYPVVISVYGSAFFSNSWKAHTFHTGIGQKLLENGYAVVSMNYRASTDAVFPAQLHDIKAAVRFIRANASTFNLDTTFIGATGWSSGGHIAAFAGVTSGIKTKKIGDITVDTEGKIGQNLTMNSGVDAVVNWFGPTDFLVMDKCGSKIKHDDAKSPESVLVGGAIQENKALAAVANPLLYVAADNPPMLIIHGDMDELVPFCQSESFFNTQIKIGATSQLIKVKNGGHGPGVLIENYFNHMANFFNETRESKQK